MKRPFEKPAAKHVTQSHMPLTGKNVDKPGGAAFVDGHLRLEVSVETLLRLPASRQLCAADFRCLDCESKQCVWRLLLMSCEETLNTKRGCNGHCSECGDSKIEAQKKQNAVSLNPENTSCTGSTPDRTAKQSVIFNDQASRHS